MAIRADFKTIYLDRQPLRDLGRGNSPVCIGTAATEDGFSLAKISALRARIIDFHFTTDQLYILQLGQRRSIVNVPLSSREILLIAFCDYYRDRKLKQAAKDSFFVMVCLIELLLVRIMQEMKPVLKEDSHKKIIQCIEYIEFLFPLVIVGLLAKRVFEFKRTCVAVSRANQEPFLVFQEFVQKPRVPDPRVTEDPRDPITYETIPLNQIFTPKILRVGPYFLEMCGALRMMFLRVHCKNGEIPHPVENRALTDGERAKFVEDICDFFCISDPEEFLECWTIDVRAQVNVEINGQITQFLEEIAKSIVPYDRAHKFIELLPKEIAQTYFTDYPQCFLPSS